MGGIDVAHGVVGAVPGMLFAVFQQPLQDGWYRLRTRSTRAVRSLGQREESSSAWRTFCLGPLQTSGLIVEGDGESSIPAEAIHIQVLDEEIELPSDTADWRAEVEKESERLPAPAIPQCGFGVNIAVVTADDMLVVSRRSDRVRMAPGVWNPSVNAGM